MLFRTKRNVALVHARANSFGASTPMLIGTGEYRRLAGC